MAPKGRAFSEYQTGGEPHFQFLAGVVVGAYQVGYRSIMARWVASGLLRFGTSILGGSIHHLHAQGDIGVLSHLLPLRPGVFLFPFPMNGFEQDSPEIFVVSSDILSA